MLQSVMPVPCPVLVPDVLPAVMPVVPAVPEFLPAAPAAPALLSRVPADLPAAGREELAAALAGPVPGAQRKVGGRQVLPGEGDPLASGLLTRCESRCNVPARERQKSNFDCAFPQVTD